MRHDRVGVALGKAKPGPAGAVRDHHRAPMPPGVIPISSLTGYRRAAVAGHVHTVEYGRWKAVPSWPAPSRTPAENSPPCSTAAHTFPGLRPGSNVQLRGTASITSTGTVMINPAYELLD
jgi:hypothetical protein